MLKSAGDKNFVIVLIIHVINILLLHFTFELLGYHWMHNQMPQYYTVEKGINMPRK